MDLITPFIKVESRSACVPAPAYPRKLKRTSHWPAVRFPFRGNWLRSQSINGFQRHFSFFSNVACYWLTSLGRPLTCFDTAYGQQVSVCRKFRGDKNFIYDDFWIPLRLISFSYFVEYLCIHISFKLWSFLNSNPMCFFFLTVLQFI